MKLPSDISKNQELKRDIIIAGLIIIVPFIFFLYNIVPKDTYVWSTKWFTISADHNEDVNFYI